MNLVYTGALAGETPGASGVFLVLGYNLHMHIKWFITNSKKYLAPEKPSAYRWVKAWVKFEWLCRHD